MYTNARSLFNKVNDLTAYVAQKKPDIILICETWLNNTTPDAAISIPEYEVSLRNDRLDTGNGIGGGLVVYSRREVTILPCDDQNDNNFNQFSSFSLMTTSGKLNIILIYRPPSSDVENLEKLCNIVTRAKKNTIIIGDFNLPSINWRRGTGDVRGRRLLEAAEEADMAQLVDFITHNKGNTLDLVLTNCPEQFLAIENEGNLKNSDHCMICVELLMSCEKKNISTRAPNWKKADLDGLKRYIGNKNWENILNSRSIERNWQTFTKILNEAVQKFVPLSTQRSADKPKWLTREIIKLLRQKKRAWKMAQAYRTELNMVRYKMVEKEVANKIRNAKRNLEKKLANAKGGNSTKIFAGYIKSKTKAKTGVGPLKNRDGAVLTGNLEMSRELNNFFSSVFTNENTSQMPNVHPETDKKIETLQITRETLHAKIKKLKEHSAPGPDGITSRLLKAAAKEILVPLKILFDASLSAGTVPHVWKKATVVPIFKKGVRGMAENYRPVSLTSIPCKIMESTIADKIIEHLANENLIRNSQHGFIKGRSCTTNLVVFMDKLTEIVDRGGTADVFYLDFSKAFDKVPHHRLLLKLKAKGIEGNLLKWIGDWLSERTQAVRVGADLSEESGVGSGVPQGSVLGPLLFDIFIDDIDECAREIDLIMKFADDTKGLQEIGNDADREKLQKALDNLVKWAEEWCMEFNVGKCKIMHVGRKNPKHKYYMYGQELKTVEEEKDIGVLVHNSLKPTKQCTKAANMAHAVLRQLERNFHFRDRHIFRKLYTQYVRPHVEFAAPAWSPWNEADIKVIESVQIKAVKMISGLEAGLSYEEKCKEIGLDTLEVRRQKQDMIQTYKILHGIDKVEWQEHYLKAQDRTQRVTRTTADPMNLVVPPARLDIRKNSYFVRAPRMWNLLPSEAKNAHTMAVFKNIINTHNTG